ncbi:MAG: hypothetical protein ACKVOE_02380 [Rickettsiales bacterium]
MVKTTIAKATSLVNSAAWNAHLRDRKRALQALMIAASGVLVSLSHKRGIEKGVLIDELRMGSSVLFIAQGKDFVVTSTPEKLLTPLLGSLVRLVELMGTEDREVVSISGDAVVGKISSQKQMTNFATQAELIKVLDTLLQMTIDLNQESGIEGGVYHYAIKLGSDVLFEARGTDYSVKENVGLLFRDLKPLMMNVIETFAKGSNIERYDSEASVEKAAVAA